MIDRKDIIADLHVHTTHSKHAYNSLRDNLIFAERRNLKYIAITDHFLRNTSYGDHDKQEIARLKGLNGEAVRKYNEFSDDKIGIISGIELNIGHNCDYPEVISTLGLVIGGFHSWFIDRYKCRENGLTVLEAMKEQIRFLPAEVICHPERDLDKLFDKEEEKLDYLNFIVDYASKNNKILEVNEASMVTYGLDDYIKYWLALAKMNDVRISIGSDAHFDFRVGLLDNSLKILNLVNYPKELVVNTNEEWLENKAIPYKNG